MVGAENVERILSKARSLRRHNIVHVSSTLYGGGVAELLSSLTILMNGAGVQTGWRVIQGRPDFFAVTKKFHNALQGGDINLSEKKLEIYEEVIEENAIRTHLDQDFVVVHDPQPLPLINYFCKRGGAFALVLENRFPAHRSGRFQSRRRHEHQSVPA